MSTHRPAPNTNQPIISLIPVFCFIFGVYVGNFNFETLVEDFTVKFEPVDDVLIANKDRNNDGKPDWILIKSLDHIMIEEQVDNDYDGNFEYIVKYDSEGYKNEGLSDRNGDGRPDHKFIFNKNGDVIKEFLDHNWDGEYEITVFIDTKDTTRIEFDTELRGCPNLIKHNKFNITHTAEYFRDCSNQPFKISHYVHGMLKTQDIDTNYDGIIDTKRFYDKDFEIKRTEPISQ